MNRPLKPPTRDEVDESDLEAYDRSIAYWAPVNGADGGRPTLENVNPWVGTLLNSPQLAWHRATVSSFVRTAGDREGSYSHYDREFVDQVLAVHLRTNVVQGIHLGDALAVGVRIEAVEALYDGRDNDLTADELLLATYIRQVVDGTVDDDTFDAIVERMGKRGAVEYTYFITVLWMTMRQWQAFGLPDPPDSEVRAALDQFRSGSREMPDWRVRIRDSNSIQPGAA